LQRANELNYKISENVSKIKVGVDELLMLKKSKIYFWKPKTG
jgi:hypothetical protein